MNKKERLRKEKEELRSKRLWALDVASYQIYKSIKESMGNLEKEGYEGSEFIELFRTRYNENSRDSLDEARLLFNALDRIEILKDELENRR